MTTCRARCDVPTDGRVGLIECIHPPQLWILSQIQSGLATMLSGCSGPLSTLDPSGPAASSIARLWWVMLVGAAAAWGATTLVIKASPLNRVSAEKTLLYQLAVSAPLLGIGAAVFGEHIDAMPSASALATVSALRHVFWYFATVVWRTSILSLSSSP